MLFLFGLILTQTVKITSFYNPELELNKGLQGIGISIRLIDNRMSKNNNNKDSWDINGDENTKIINTVDKTYICGKEKDPGVVTCTHQNFRSWFKIEREGEKVFFKTDGDLCLTKAAFDEISKGFFLNTKKCEKLPSQAFRIIDLDIGNQESGNDTSKTPSEEIYSGLIKNRDSANSSRTSVYDQNPEYYNNIASNYDNPMSQLETCSPNKSYYNQTSMPMQTAICESTPPPMYFESPMMIPTIQSMDQGCTLQSRMTTGTSQNAICDPSFTKSNVIPRTSICETPPIKTYHCPVVLPAPVVEVPIMNTPPPTPVITTIAPIPVPVVNTPPPTPVIKTIAPIPIPVPIVNTPSPVQVVTTIAPIPIPTPIISIPPPAQVVTTTQPVPLNCETSPLRQQQSPCEINNANLLVSECEISKVSKNIINPNVGGNCRI